MRPQDCKGRPLVEGSPARLVNSIFVRSAMQGLLCKVERQFSEEERKGLEVWLLKNYGPSSSEIVLQQGLPVWIRLEASGDRMWIMSSGLELQEIEQETSSWAVVDAICGWRPA